jgi:hypothetical protein
MMSVLVMADQYGINEPIDFILMNSRVLMRQRLKCGAISSAKPRPKKLSSAQRRPSSLAKQGNHLLERPLKILRIVARLRFLRGFKEAIVFIGVIRFCRRFPWHRN